MSGGFPSLPDAETTLEISPRAVAEWIRLPANQRPRLIDCREQDELAICRIEGHEWLPLGSFSVSLEKLTSDTGRGVVVYCHHGVRSLQVVAWLREQGVARCTSMEGGIDRWSVEVDSTVPRYF